MKTTEGHLTEHCNLEYHKETGERIVHSSLAAVEIAMEEYAKELAKEHAIEFGLWVNHHRINKTENFDFAPGDTDGWYEEWITGDKK